MARRLGDPLNEAGVLDREEALRDHDVESTVSTSVPTATSSVSG